MPSKEYLRDLARQALTTDKIPNRWPDRVSSIPGIGAPCAICASPVYEMEFEAHWAMDLEESRFDLFHFHDPCFAAWEFARKAARESHEGGSMRSVESTLPEARERQCPACQSEQIGHAGLGFVSGRVIKTVSVCEACGCAFWLVGTMAQ
jgi:hypothetical protein